MCNYRLKLYPAIMYIFSRNTAVNVCFVNIFFYYLVHNDVFQLNIVYLIANDVLLEKRTHAHTRIV